MTAENPVLDIDHLRQWIGREDEAHDIITPRLVLGLRVTLFLEPGAPKTGDVAPLTTHWCMAPATVPMSEISVDGHPARGGFLPPVPLPRRMWAGGRVEFLDSLRVGDDVRRISRIADVTLKQGSTGPLCFVTVQHDIHTPRGLAIRDRQDIVYREAESAKPQGDTAAAPKAEAPAQHSQSYMADPVLLFRYSAITFNGHRIHYDRPYVMNEEHYPGLVVHGPLQASLLAEFAQRLRGQSLKTFDYRGVRPLIDGAPFSVNANAVDGAFDLYTANAQGVATMKARAT